MLELTEVAKSRLHESLAAADKTVRQGKCFRIVPKDDNSMTLKIATPASNDTIFTHDGDKILALPKALRPYFKDKCLDIDPTGRLRLH